MLVQHAGLWQGNHDGLAAFMAATGRAALPEAAALSGLSLQKEFELCKGGLPPKHTLKQSSHSPLQGLDMLALICA